MPFVKKATMSLLDGEVFYLDGHNNPGFSGGPVVYIEPPSREYRVAAVVSAYRAEPQPIYAGSVEMPLTYRYNTGIIVTHAINAALRLIRSNPIGCDLARASEQSHIPG